MSPLRIIYLALAVWGAIEAMTSYYGLFLEVGTFPPWHGYDWYVNFELSNQLPVAVIALTVWVVAETRVRRNWSALWSIPATLLLGLSCGFPLYLFLRTRPIA